MLIHILAQILTYSEFAGIFKSTWMRTGTDQIHEERGRETFLILDRTWALDRFHRQRFN